MVHFGQEDGTPNRVDGQVDQGCAPALNPPRWSGKKTAIAAALAVGMASAGTMAAAAAVPAGTGAAGAGAGPGRFGQPFPNRGQAPMGPAGGFQNMPMGPNP